MFNVVAQTVPTWPASALASASKHSEAALKRAPPRTTKRRKRASQMMAGQQQQQQIQSLAGQRLVIPCRNSSKTPQTVPPPASPPGQQSRRPGGAGQWAQQQQARGRIQPSGLPPAPFQQMTSGGVALIVWHKDDQLNSPIFVADARGSSIREAKQQAISDSLRGRARADLIEAGGGLSLIIALIIEDVRLEDAGLYTCTIEFDRAPTQMFQTTVGVFDPPKNMIIREDLPNSNRRLTTTSLAGPYDEGSHLALVCEVEPGQPEAGQVSWWQLESVTQIGGELLNMAGAASRSSTEPSRDSLGVQQTQLLPMDSATHLTTLSIDPSGTYQNRPVTSPNQELMNQAQENTSNLYLGARSFQQQQVAPQQLVGQLLLSSNLTSSLLLQSSTGQRLVGARLRHWRRVDSGTSANGATLSARLEIKKLARSNLGDEFLCLASNNHFSTPLNASLTLDLNLKPLETRLINKPTNGSSDFKLGQKTMVECHVIGSKPSPTIRWFRGAREIELPPGGEGVSDNVPNAPTSAATTSVINRDISNLTKISYLTLTPTINDNQQSLTCSAFNPKLVPPHVEMGGQELGLDKSDLVSSDSIVMNVQFQPRLKLQFGAGIRPDSIKLGGDIFMDCDIHANPSEIQELVWLHESRPLAANISSGVIMSNQSLVLRNIGVHQRGVYECRARNALGQSTSNRLVLEPRHEPICDETLTRRRYEIPLNQPTRIECHVLAEPDEDLHFVWRFNRSSGSATELSAQDDALDQAIEPIGADSTGSEALLESAVLKQYETNFTRGSAVFTATSKRHFGQLLCSASNSMGKQERPCAILLVQSELPGPVHGCFVDNQTPSSFSIHCQSSANLPPQASLALPVGQAKHSSGGTHYILELYASKLPAARTSERGSSDPMGHLRSRQQATGEQTPADYDDDDPNQHFGLDQELSELQAVQRQRQTRVRRLESELPSFDVADLQPNSTYNIVIYVQNSKGRSPAAHHQVVLSGSNQAGGFERTTTGEAGRLELLGRRTSSQRASASKSASSQLLSFLKIDDLFNGTADSANQQHHSSSALPPPLIAVALIVLLGAISIVTVVFFVNRLICPAGRTTPTGRNENSLKTGSTKSSRRYVIRKTSTGASSCSPTNGRDEDDHEQSDEQFVKHRKLDPQNISVGKGAERRSQQHANVGSGSDTSRETNTDSTLVSSSPASKLASKQADFTPSSGGHVYCADNLPGPLVTTRNKRCSHSDLSQLTATALLGGHEHHQQQLLNFNNDHGFKSSTLKPSSGRLLVAMRPAQQQAVSYGTNRTTSTRRNNQYGHRESAHSLNHFESNQSRGTPQVSVHSSECSSNNVDNSLDLTVPHHNQHRHHYSPSPLNGQLQRLAHHNYLLSSQCHQELSGQDDNQLDVGRLAGVADSGIYVISDASSEPYQRGNSEETPIGIFDATPAREFWCQQVTPQHNRNSCHLIDDSPNSMLRNHTATNAGGSSLIMSNSFSIPVSLMETAQSDRPSSTVDYQLDGQLSRRLSSADNMLLERQQHNEQLEVSNWSSPIGPSAFDCGASAGVCLTTSTPTNQHNHLTPPIDFATDYKCYQRTIPMSQSIEYDSNAKPILPREPPQQQPSTRHRVKFNTPNCGTKFDQSN